MASRYAICSCIGLVKPATYQSSCESPLTVAAQPMRSDEIEPRSIMLLFLLLSAFIGILTLRAHLLATASSSAAVAAHVGPPIARAVKLSSLRLDF